MNVMFTGFGFALGILAVACLVLFVVAAYQILSSKALSLGYKALWMAVIIVLPVLGPILFFVLRPHHDETAVA